MNTGNTRCAYFVLLLALPLVACGGGGGASSNASPASVNNGSNASSAAASSSSSSVSSSAASSISSSSSVSSSATSSNSSSSSSSSQYSIQISQTTVRFSGEIDAAPPPSQQLLVTFNGDGVVVGYPIGVTPAIWLNVSIGSGTSSQVPVTLSIKSNAIALGTYATTLRFVSVKADGSVLSTQDVAVSFVLIDPIKINVNALQFDSTVGQVAMRAATISGSNLRWSTKASQPWLSVVPSSGMSPGPIQVTVNADTVGPGTYAAELTVTDANTNITRVVPVSFEVTANRWNVSRTGVSLLDFADNSKSEARVIVTNDAHSTLNWNASTNENWLTVTSSGSDGGDLIIDANSNVAALSADSVHYATVTVNGGGLAGDSVRVGYYRSSKNEPAEMHYSVDTSKSNPTTGLIVDPVRPYAYLGVSTPDVIRVNLITGAKDVLFSTPGAKVFGIAVSGDGSTLYATTVVQPGDIVRFDLDAGSVLTPLSSAILCCSQELVWVRNRGVPALITNYLEVFNLRTNSASSIINAKANNGIDLNVPFYWYIAASRDSTELWSYHATNALGCSSGRSYRIVTRPSTGDAYLTPYRQPPAISGGDCITMESFATSHNSASWYVVNGNPYYGNAYYSGPPGGSLTLSNSGQYVLLTASYSDRIALIYGVPSSGVRVFDSNGNTIRDLIGFDRSDVITFVGDGRFILINGSYTGASGSLHLFRIP